MEHTSNGRQVRNGFVYQMVGRIAFQATSTGNRPTSYRLVSNESSLTHTMFNIGTVRVWNNSLNKSESIGFPEFETESANPSFPVL